MSITKTFSVSMLTLSRFTHQARLCPLVMYSWIHKQWSTPSWASLLIDMRLVTSPHIPKPFQFRTGLYSNISAHGHVTVV